MWKPPVHGPRRLHVAPNGLVWVPGWASGDLVSFDPTAEESSEVYKMPKGPIHSPTRSRQSRGRLNPSLEKTAAIHVRFRFFHC